MAERNLASTATLIRALRQGDAEARGRLIERCLPLLRRWARGRLPHYGRDLHETDDIVQVSLMRALNRLETFDAQRPGAFIAYLRTILMNVVREEIRRTARTGQAWRPAESLADPGLSLVDRVIGQQTMERYEDALASLTAAQREAVVLRIEFDMTYPEIAAELEADSPDAVRMLVARGLATLAESMR